MAFTFDRTNTMRDMNEAINEWTAPRKPAYKLGSTTLENFISVKEDESAYICLSAEPGAGKTAMAVQIAAAMSDRAKVGYYTFEVPRSNLRDRLASNISGIDITRFRRDKEPLTEEETARVAEAMYGRLGRRDIEFIDAGGATVDDVIRDADAAGYNVVILDHIGCIQTRASYSRTDEVRNISARLRDWRQSKKGLILIVLSQLPKAAYGQSAKAMTALGPKDSGSVYEDCDVMVYMHRAILGSEEEQGLVDMVIAKNRNGIVGGDYVRFDGLHQRFDELTMEEKLRIKEIAAQNTKGGKK